MIFGIQISSKVLLLGKSILSVGKNRGIFVLTPEKFVFFHFLNNIVKFKAKLFVFLLDFSKERNSPVVFVLVNVFPYKFEPSYAARTGQYLLD